MSDFNIVWDSYCDKNRAYYRHACRKLGYTGTLEEYCLEYLLECTNDDITKDMFRYFYNNRYEQPTYEKYMGQLVLDKTYKTESEERLFKKALKKASEDSFGTGELADFKSKNYLNQRVRDIVLFLALVDENEYGVLNKKGYDVSKIQKWNDDVRDIISYLKNLQIVFRKDETIKNRKKALSIVMNSRIGQCFDDEVVEYYNSCVFLSQTDEFLLDLDDNFEEDMKISATKKYFVEDIRLRKGRIVLVNAKKYRRYGVHSNWLINNGKEY